MAELDLLDQEKKKVGTVPASDDVFGVRVREHLVQRYVVMQQAAKRSGTASTKTSMKELRGSGKKPWRQKGTGRARAGRTRSAIWRGGMTVFGPKPRDYSFKLSRKSKKLALKSVLTERVQNDKILVVNDLNLAEPKTSQAVALLKKLELPNKTLFVVAEENQNLSLAVRNLPDADVLPVEGINAYDLLIHECVVCTPEALKKIEERLN